MWSNFITHLYFLWISFIVKRFYFYHLVFDRIRSRVLVSPNSSQFLIYLYAKDTGLLTLQVPDFRGRPWTPTTDPYPFTLHKSLVSSSTSQLPLLEPVNNTETKSWVSRYSRCPEALWKSQRIKCVCSQYKSCLIDISLHSNFGKFCRCRDRTQLLRFFKKCISSILTNGPVLCLLHPLE